MPVTPTLSEQQRIELLRKYESKVAAPVSRRPVEVEQADLRVLIDLIRTPRHFDATRGSLDAHL